MKSYMVLACALASAATVPASATSAAASAKQIARIQARFAACKRALGQFPGTTELQDCDFKAVDAAKKLTFKSRGNAELERLFPDLFEPAEYYIAGEDALAIRVVIASEYSEFALRRAAILTGVGGPTARKRYSEERIQALLKKISPGRKYLTDGRTLAREWISVRDADCAAYAVQDCRQRLNAAFGAMLDRLLNKYGSAVDVSK